MSAVRINNGSVEVNSSGKVEVYNPLWLRDNCRCEECVHPATMQKTVDSLKIPANIVPTAASVRNDKVHLRWENGHESEYSAGWLEEACGLTDAARRRELASARQAWGRELGDSLPSEAFDEVMASTNAVRSLLTKFYTYGLCVVTGTPVSTEGTEEVLRRIAPIRETFYGGLWSFTNDASVADLAYSSVHLGPHTDGTYFREAPGIQSFHVLKSHCTGGETLLADGLKAYTWLDEHSPDTLDLLRRTPLPFKYVEPGDDGLRGRKYTNRAPTFRATREGHFMQIQFNCEDQAPLDMPMNEVGAVYSALRELSEYLNRPENLIQAQLEPGMTLIFDNWRVLHGRTAFVGDREVCGAYQNHEDYASQCYNVGVDTIFHNVGV